MPTTREINDVLIDVDARGRTNLSKLTRGERFLAKMSTDGTITLEPARVVTAAQERLMRNPQVITAVQRAEAAVADAVDISIATPEDLE